MTSQLVKAQVSPYCRKCCMAHEGLTSMPSTAAAAAAVGALYLLQQDGTVAPMHSSIRLQLHVVKVLAQRAHAVSC